jgi:hypothetical protein
MDMDFEEDHFSSSMLMHVHPWLIFIGVHLRASAVDLFVVSKPALIYVRGTDGAI